MPLAEFIKSMNTWGQNKIPFLFVVDFEMKKPFAVKLTEIDKNEMLYFCNGMANGNFTNQSENIQIRIAPPGLEEFRKKFSVVAKHLEYGDSYLTNLTIKTPLKLNKRLHELFYRSKAKYKLWFRDEFLVFSPETFVQISNGKIFSYPMKGTIDASIPSAEEKILNDPKELAEHVTIVDLIRNDLSEISTEVKVNRFRYIDTLKTSDKTLLQVSSEIVGKLESDYSSRLGNIIVSLLPAGSVSGAPKAKTLEIIRKAEGEDRGYYTGVFGIFDGHNLDSGVMIRFIEQHGELFYYRSGGGITTQSIAEYEYQEAIDKIYVPLN